MPKQTFFNLPADKRTALLALATEEFADHDYATASLSKIVERAGIAKGSLYQYFTDKEEMYLYLVEYAAQTLLNALGETLPAKAAGDFFTTLRRLMSATIRVHAGYPQLSRLLQRSSQAPVALRTEVAKRTGAIAQHYYWDLVRAGIAQGDLKPTLDPMLATIMIGALLGQVGPYIVAQLGIDLENSHTVDPACFDTPVVEAIFDQIIDLLRDGLINRG